MKQTHNEDSLEFINDCWGPPAPLVMDTKLNNVSVRQIVRLIQKAEQRERNRIVGFLMERHPDIAQKIIEQARTVYEEGTSE